MATRWLQLFSSIEMGEDLAADIERGDGYRDVHRGLYGIPGAEWIVDALFRGIDGVAYAQLVCASDLSLRKTLSLYALSDRRRFLRVSDAYVSWQLAS